MHSRRTCSYYFGVAALQPFADTLRFTLYV
jgi:hypothetical protein